MIRIHQIKVLPEVSLDAGRLESVLRKKIQKLLRLKNEPFTYRIVKKSVDSRKKPDIFIIYAVDVELERDDEQAVLNKVYDNNIMLSKTVKYSAPKPVRPYDRPAPVIAGFGPAGMFCALMLARAGYKPIVLERGEPAGQRVLTVDKFWRKGKLNPNSNAQFGEGGAGTFSDGKLNTQVKEVYGRIGKVLEIFAEHGADGSILYEAKPHIGTDKLVDIVQNIREEILSLGGRVLFNTQMVDVEIRDSKLACVLAKNLDTGELFSMECDTLVLAVGHSARDTFYTLEKKLVMEPKAFAVGLRIEHAQELINIHEFGDGRYKNYMPASYKLAYKASNKRGVYSFCMCPGGYVVNASSEEGRLAVNGMSYSGRDGKNANAALIVTVECKDFCNKDFCSKDFCSEDFCVGDGGGSALAGIEFQRRLEEAAYKLREGKIPVQLFGDFKRGIPTSPEALANNPIQPQIKGGYAGANLRSILPPALAEALIEGVEYFDRQIPGYADEHAVFSGIESRTSSPVRIVRDEAFLAKGIQGIYPCGEGAGYAGGITSAAVDGIKVYEAVVTMKTPR